MISLERRNTRVILFTLHAMKLLYFGFGFLRLLQPCHEIMALFVLRKPILQTRMRSHPGGARCPIFGRTHRLLPYFMCANSEGSGETARMRRIAWSFDVRLCYKYHNFMKCLILSHCLSAFLIKKKKKKKRIRFLTHLENKFLYLIRRIAGYISDNILFSLPGTGDEEVMNQIPQPIVADSNCTGFYIGYLPNTEMCAGYTNGGKDFCNVRIFVQYSRSVYSLETVKWCYFIEQTLTPNTFSLQGSITYIIFMLNRSMIKKFPQDWVQKQHFV